MEVEVHSVVTSDTPEPSDPFPEPFPSTVVQVPVPKSVPNMNTKLTVLKPPPPLLKDPSRAKKNTPKSNPVTARTQNRRTNAVVPVSKGKLIPCYNLDWFGYTFIWCFN